MMLHRIVVKYAWGIDIFGVDLDLPTYRTCMFEMPSIYKADLSSFETSVGQAEEMYLKVGGPWK